MSVQMQQQLVRIRMEFIDQIWRLLAGVAAVAVPMSLLRSVGTGWLPVYNLHILLGTIIWVAVFNLHRLHWRIKVNLMAALMSIAGFAGIITFGATSPGFWWLAMACLVVSAMYERRVGILFCAAVVGLLVLIAAAYIGGWLRLDPRIYNYFNLPGTWATMLVAVVFFTVVLLLWNRAYMQALDAAMKIQLQQLEDVAKVAQAASQAKSEFVANMSHEIRTPMNAVLGMAHLLNQTPLSAEQQTYLDMISSSGQALLGVLNDILDFSKIEAGRMELHEAPFELDDVLDGVAGIMNAAADKGLELVIAVAPDVSMHMHGDALRLRQILLNLVGNALKFTTRGKVELRLAARPIEGDVLWLDCAVQDTGIGMTPQQKERLFSAFSQGDASITRQFGGTGLGLVICRRLCDMMGGAIQMQSVQGEGSTFSFQARLRQIRRPLPAALPAWRTVRLLRGPHSSANALQQAFAHWQLQLELCDDCDALQAQPAADLILLDSAHAHTFSWLQQQRNTPGLPPLILLCDAHTRSHLPPELPPLHILLKPFTPRGLLHVLQALPQANPRVAEALPLPRHAAAAGERLQLRLDGRRILLVEDNPLNQLVAGKVLRQAGALVEIVENGALALQQLARDADYALVLMDVQMPVMDGFTATRKLRSELGLQLPVLAMSAGVMDGERANCLAAGMNDFIAKPIEINQMFATIAAWLPPRNPLPARGPVTSDSAQDVTVPLLPALAAGTQQASGVAEPASSTSVSTPVSLEGIFNLGDLEQWNSDDPEYRIMLRELVQRMVERGPRDMQQARQDWQQGENNSAARHLHSLRGALGTLGALQFAEQTIILEQLLKAGAESSLIEAGFAACDGSLALTLQGARDWLARQETIPD